MKVCVDLCISVLQLQQTLRKTILDDMLQTGKKAQLKGFEQVGRMSMLTATTTSTRMMMFTITAATASAPPPFALYMCK